MTSDRSDHNDVEQLLALAGPRDAVPAERLERMRASVRDAWIEQMQPRAKRQFAWMLVMAAAVAAVVAISVVRTRPPAGADKAEAPARGAAAQILTRSGERQSLLLPWGGELRIDGSSDVIVGEGRVIRLKKGAIYLDSNGTTLTAVITPAGRITDIGTRFEVRLLPGAAGQVNTRVRVRDGKVRLTQASTVSDISAAEELVASADGSTTRHHVDPFGAEWAWVARAAPRFELEGRSLGDFLGWIAKEGAWTITFASPALERSARSTVLHGSIEHMSTTEALSTILPACGLTHRVDLKTGRVTVIGPS